MVNALNRWGFLRIAVGYRSKNQTSIVSAQAAPENRGSLCAF